MAFKLLWSVKYDCVMMVNICVVATLFVHISDYMGLEPFEEVMITYGWIKT